MKLKNEKIESDAELKRVFYSLVKDIRPDKNNNKVELVQDIDSNKISFLVKKIPNSRLSKWQKPLIVFIVWTLHHFIFLMKKENDAMLGCGIFGLLLFLISLGTPTVMNPILDSVVFFIVMPISSLLLFSKLKRNGSE